MATLGSFTLIKGEADWIAGHLSAWRPHLDQMVFFDGNSTDGTLEIIKAFQKNSDKIKLVENADPKDLQGDYVRMFDRCMRSLDTDMAIFLHPDMLPARVTPNWKSWGDDVIAGSVGMRSFAGEPGGPLYEIGGRAQAWKNIYRLNNPDLGARYHGHYGAANEDVYLTSITGDEYAHHGTNFDRYPYEVVQSGIEILHFSDVRTPRRRYERMVSSLMNQGFGEDRARELAVNHPRVTLKDGEGFAFLPAEYPAEFLDANAKYANLRRMPCYL